MDNKTRGADITFSPRVAHKLRRYGVTVDQVFARRDLNAAYDRLRHDRFGTLIISTLLAPLIGLPVGAAVSLTTARNYKDAAATGVLDDVALATYTVDVAARRKIKLRRRQAQPHPAG